MTKPPIPSIEQTFDVAIAGAPAEADAQKRIAYVS
jgi:hypothetical protein